MPTDRFKNIPPRLTPEEIIERAEYEEACRIDLDCLGEEPSDDELIEDEKRRNQDVKHSNKTRNTNT